MSAYSIVPCFEQFAQGEDLQLEIEVFDPNGDKPNLTDMATYNRAQVYLYAVNDLLRKYSTDSNQHSTNQWAEAVIDAVNTHKLILTLPSHVTKQCPVGNVYAEVILSIVDNTYADSERRTPIQITRVANCQKSYSFS
jgi:hypothetical protein